MNDTTALTASPARWEPREREKNVLATLNQQDRQLVFNAKNARTEISPHEMSPHLLKAAKMVGVTELPTTEEFNDIAGFIIRNHPKLDCNDVRTAFEMAISGKLSLDEEQLNNFGKFSTLYVSRILQHYHQARIRAELNFWNKTDNEESRERTNLQAAAYDKYAGCADMWMSETIEILKDDTAYVDKEVTKFTASAVFNTLHSVGVMTPEIYDALAGQVLVTKMPIEKTNDVARRQMLVTMTKRIFGKPITLEHQAEFAERYILKIIFHQKNRGEFSSWHLKPTMQDMHSTMILRIKGGVASAESINPAKPKAETKVPRKKSATSKKKK